MRHRLAMPVDAAPRRGGHGLRHAAATLLLEAVEELTVVDRVHGHADLGAAADAYAHFTGYLAKRAAVRMDTILCNPEPLPAAEGLQAGLPPRIIGPGGTPPGPSRRWWWLARKWLARKGPNL